MAPATQPPAAFQWFTQGKQPPGGLPSNIFNPFATPPTAAVAPTASMQQSGFNSAGRWASALKQAQDVAGFMDPNDPLKPMVVLGISNQILNQDPELLKEQASIYEGIQNRLADAATERAMKGHIFAGLLNMPNKWQQAMSEKYRFVEPNLRFVQQAGESASPFVTRQYINI